MPFTILIISTTLLSMCTPNLSPTFNTAEGMSYSFVPFSTETAWSVNVDWYALSVLLDSSTLRLARSSIIETLARVV